MRNVGLNNASRESGTIIQVSNDWHMNGDHSGSDPGKKKGMPGNGFLSKRQRKRHSESGQVSTEKERNASFQCALGVAGVEGGTSHEPGWPSVVGRKKRVKRGEAT